MDEFDKSLEVGFEGDMKEIMEALPNLTKRILTSATQKLEVPEFVGLEEPKTLSFESTNESILEVRLLETTTGRKFDTLVQVICNHGDQRGIVFCNFRESVQEVSAFLTHKNISHGCFYGTMDQLDRERTLIKFRNGTHRLIVATDLAARGIDVPEIEFIVHFEVPHKEDEFIHRNGRTARMHNDGRAFVLHCTDKKLASYIEELSVLELKEAPIPKPPSWSTLFISGGRKDKISKGDIAGLFFKQGKLEKGDLGVIELKRDCAFVSVHSDKAASLIRILDRTKLKKKNVRISKI